MSLPSLNARPSRLSGFAIPLLLVALSVSSIGMGPAGLSAAGAAAPSPTSWQWPIGPTRAVVRPFIAPPTPYSAGHRGIDIGATAGASVVAPTDGVVHFVGVVVDRPVVSIRHPGGLISSFEPVESDLAEGETVARGEQIGTLVHGGTA